MPKIKSRRRRSGLRAPRSQAGKRLLSESPNAIRLRRLRAKAVKRGLCRVCRFRYPKAGLKICAHCNGLKNDRAAGYVASGLCACGRARATGKMRCEACSASAERSRKRRVSRLVIIGRCTKCGVGWPKKPGGTTCPSCIANVDAYAILRRAVNQAAGLCGCGRARVKGTERCSRCRARSTVARIRSARAVRAAS